MFRGTRTAVDHQAAKVRFRLLRVPEHPEAQQTVRLGAALSPDPHLEAREQWLAHSVAVQAACYWQKQRAIFRWFFSLLV